MATKLYPLKFKPILMDRIWGGTKLSTVLGKSLGGKSKVGESWELSGVEGHVSIVQNGFLQGNELNELIEVYMGDLVGEEVYGRFGNEFPLLFKFIDAHEPLSIQVHPGDELAAERHNSFGKSELWYIMQADKNAFIINGFNHEISKDDYVKSVENKVLEPLLATHFVSSGDVFYLPAGRVHAIGAGILLAEIQQTSDVTYRIYDFDRKDDKGKTRELHTELALEAIDFKTPENIKASYKVQANKVVDVVKSPYFITNFLQADKPMECDYYQMDSFVTYICVEGKAELEYGDGLKETISMGETVLIPAELDYIKIIPIPKVKILEVFLP